MKTKPTSRTGAYAQFPVEIKLAKFGAWTLGFADVSMEIGGVRVPALALYAKKGDKEHRIVTAPQIKFAVAWLEGCKVPARIAAKLLCAIYEKGAK